ncbi:hypothetical protein FHG87_006939 [Trinorchestia longiramus]|nr:hypothetical protein FHG87_006939 [Trinorchestia longiramus]
MRGDGASDFNLSCVKWSTRRSRAPGSKLIDLVNTNSLKQHVNEQTVENNIEDLVMMTPDGIIRLEITNKIGDHHLIDLALQVRDPNNRGLLKTTNE